MLMTESFQLNTHFNYLQFFNNPAQMNDMFLAVFGFVGRKKKG